MKPRLAILDAYIAARVSGLDERSARACAATAYLQLCQQAGLREAIEVVDAVLVLAPRDVSRGTHERRGEVLFRPVYRLAG